MYGLDIETTGKGPADKLVSVQLWDPNSQCGYFYDCRIQREAAEAVYMLERNSVIVFSSLFDSFYVLKDLGVVLDVVGDASTIAFLTQQPKRSLEELSQKFLSKGKTAKLADLTEGTFSFDKVLTDEDRRYGIEDARLAFELEWVMREKLLRDEDWMRAYRLEISLIPVLVKMRVQGLHVDENRLRREIAELEVVGQTIKEKLYEEAGWQFRVNARADLMKVLFEEKGFPHPPVRTGKGAVSVSSEALAFLDHIPFVKDLIKVKHIESVISSQMDIWRNLIDGYLHPEFRPIGFDGSSRIYTSGPSANQMPKELRRAVISSPGNKFIYLDWSGAELMLLAYLAGQQDLIDHYEAGGDPHRFVVSKMNGKALEAISDEEREISKIVTFSVVFGSEGDAASRALKISQEEARDLIDSFYRGLPVIRLYLDFLIMEGTKTGYAKSVSGRKRRLEKAFSSDPKIQEEAKRQMLNTPVQSGVADLMKVAMVRIAKSVPDVDLRFVVFDSFLLEVREDFSVARIMPKLEEIFTFKVAGKVIKFNFKVKEGKSWGVLMS